MYIVVTVVVISLIIFKFFFFFVTTSAINYPATPSHPTDRFQQVCFCYCILIVIKTLKCLFFFLFFFLVPWLKVWLYTYNIFLLINNVCTWVFFFIVWTLQFRSNLKAWRLRIDLKHFYVAPKKVLKYLPSDLCAGKKIENIFNLPLASVVSCHNMWFQSCVLTCISVFFLICRYYTLLINTLIIDHVYQRNLFYNLDLIVL